MRDMTCWDWIKHYAGEWALYLALALFAGLACMVFQIRNIQQAAMVAVWVVTALVALSLFAAAIRIASGPPICIHCRYVIVQEVEQPHTSGYRCRCESEPAKRHPVTGAVDAEAQYGRCDRLNSRGQCGYFRLRGKEQKGDVPTELIAGAPTQPSGVEVVQNRAIEAYRESLRDGSDYGPAMVEAERQRRRDLEAAAQRLAKERLKQ